MEILEPRARARSLLTATRSKRSPDGRLAIGRPRRDAAAARLK
jgi:hypothetical protein